MIWIIQNSVNHQAVQAKESPSPLFSFAMKKYSYSKCATKDQVHK